MVSSSPPRGPQHVTVAHPEGFRVFTRWCAHEGALRGRHLRAGVHHRQVRLRVEGDHELRVEDRHVALAALEAVRRAAHVAQHQRVFAEQAERAGVALEEPARRLLGRGGGEVEADDGGHGRLAGPHRELRVGEVVLERWCRAQHRDRDELEEHGRRGYLGAAFRSCTRR
jgi:hypothetical protein